MKSSVAIFTVLLAMLAFQYWKGSWPWQPRCLLSRVDADFNAICSSLKTYKLNAGQYPTTEQGLAALVHEPTSPPLPRRWTKIADRIPNDRWNNPYQYRRLSDDDPRGFEISSAGKDGQFGTEDDLSSLDPK